MLYYLINQDAFDRDHEKLLTILFQLRKKLFEKDHEQPETILFPLRSQALFFANLV